MDLIEKIYDEVTSTGKKIVQMDGKIDHVIDTQGEHERRIKALEERPKMRMKKWEKITIGIIGTVAAGVILFIITNTI